MPFRGLLTRINRWLQPAAVGSAVDPATSTVQTPSAAGVKVVLGEIEEAERTEPEQAAESDEPETR